MIRLGMKHPPRNGRPTSEKTGPLRDGQARLGTDTTTSERQARLGTDIPTSGQLSELPVSGRGVVVDEKRLPVRRFAFLPPPRQPLPGAEREICIDNLLVRIHFIIVILSWTGLALWEFEFPFPGSLTSTFPGSGHSFVSVRCR